MIQEHLPRGQFKSLARMIEFRSKFGQVVVNDSTVGFLAVELPHYVEIRILGPAHLNIHGVRMKVWS